jgi:hypothetical protein
METPTAQKNVATIDSSTNKTVWGEGAIPNNGNHSNDPREIANDSVCETCQLVYLSLGIHSVFVSMPNPRIMSQIDAIYADTLLVGHQEYF